MSKSLAALPPAFHKLAIYNLMAQSAEQLTLATLPIVIPNNRYLPYFLADANHQEYRVNFIFQLGDSL